MPPTETSPAKLRENRSYTTYKARLQTYLRLKRKAKAWTTVLTFLSTDTLIISIFNFAFPPQERFRASVGFYSICAAAIVNITALVIAREAYAERAQQAYIGYRHLQRISSHLELLNMTNGQIPQDLKDFENEYQMILDFTENHSTDDFMSVSEPQSDPHNGTSAKSEAVRQPKQTFRFRLTQFEIICCPILFALLGIAIWVPLLMWR